MLCNLPGRDYPIKNYFWREGRVNFGKIGHARVDFVLVMLMLIKSIHRRSFA